MSEPLPRCGICTFPLAHDEPGPFCAACMEDYGIDDQEGYR